MPRLKRSPGMNACLSDERSVRVCVCVDEFQEEGGGCVEAMKQIFLKLSVYIAVKERYKF